MKILKRILLILKKYISLIIAKKAIKDKIYTSKRFY